VQKVYRLIWSNQTLVEITTSYQFQMSQEREIRADVRRHTIRSPFYEWLKQNADEKFL